VAWFVGVSSIALLLAALILYLIDRSQIVLPQSVGVWSVFTGIDIAVNIPVPLLGILIASRRPRNPNLLGRAGQPQAGEPIPPFLPVAESLQLQ
jgi:hypothetical protein